MFDRRSKLTLANFFRRSLFQLHFYCFWLFVLNVSIHECFHPFCEFFTSRKCFQSCDFHTFTIFSQRFSRLYYCSVIKVLLPVSLGKTGLSVVSLFRVCHRRLVYIIIWVWICQHLFYTFFQMLFFDVFCRFLRCYNTPKSERICRIRLCS